MPRGPGRARTRGDRLHELRDAAQLTVRGLADAAGVEPSVVSRAEAGETPLSLSASVRVARALRAYGASVEDLTELTDEAERPVVPVQRPAGAA